MYLFFTPVPRSAPSFLTSVPLSSVSLNLAQLSSYCHCISRVCLVVQSFSNVNFLVISYLLLLHLCFSVMCLHIFLCLFPIQFLFLLSVLILSVSPFSYFIEFILFSLMFLWYFFIRIFEIFLFQLRLFSENFPKGHSDLLFLSLLHAFFLFFMGNQNGTDPFAVYQFCCTF
jgi:hypothetical protein